MFGSALFSLAVADSTNHALNFALLWYPVGLLAAFTGLCVVTVGLWAVLPRLRFPAWVSQGDMSVNYAWRVRLGPFSFEHTLVFDRRIASTPEAGVIVAASLGSLDA